MSAIQVTLNSVTVQENSAVHRTVSPPLAKYENFAVGDGRHGNYKLSESTILCVSVVVCVYL